MIKSYIHIFLISMLPAIELRGAIPYGAILGVPYMDTVIVSIIGNLLPMPLVYFLLHRILIWGKDGKYIGKIFTKILQKGHRAGEKITKRGELGVFLAIMLFVAIPIPGTGAWTATLACSILEIDFKKSFLAIILGVLVAAFIVTFLSFIVVR